MKKVILLIIGAMVAITTMSQTKLAEVEIIREWNSRIDVELSPGDTYEWILGDDTARYFKPVGGVPLRARLVVENAETPPPPPPNIVYKDTIDDRDARVKYSAGWTAYTNTMYHKRTAQYNNAANNSFTVPFTGYKVQWWGEKRLNHGNARVDIFNDSSRLIFSRTVSQYNPRSENISELLFQKDSLKQGKYTMVVTMAVPYNMTDYIVAFSKLPIVGSVEPPVTPPAPIENSIHVNPGANLKQILETASAGKTVIIENGTYPTQPIHIPVGVNVLCNGATLQAVANGTENSGIKAGIINLSSGSRTTGNQYVKGCKMDGRNTGYSAVMVNNRDNVTIENLTVQDFNFNGVWISNSTGSRIANSSFTNTGWSDTRYLSGAINIAGVTNTIIEHSQFFSDRDNKGTGIEALWKNTTLTNVKILNNKFNLSHYNPWNNGSSKNFSIELHDTYYRGLEIAHNEFQNEMSLASHKPGNGTKTIIHDNVGNLEGDTYFIETVADDFEVYNNTVSNSQMFAANFQPNSKWKNWTFKNNRLNSPAGMPSWGGSVLIGPLGVENVLLEANILPSPTVKYMGINGGVTVR
jgi:hypothetical protein